MSQVAHSVVEGALNKYFYQSVDSAGTGMSVNALYPIDYPGTAIGAASAAMFATLSALSEATSSHSFVDCASSNELPILSVPNSCAAAQARYRRNLAWTEMPTRESHSGFLTLAMSVLSSARIDIYSFEPKASTASNVELEAELHLSKMKFFERASSRRRALDYMYEFLEESFASKKLEMINEMLLKASTDLVGHSLSVGFLRATSRARDRLNFWDYYFDAVKVSLEGNPDSERILRGLSK